MGLLNQFKTSHKLSFIIALFLLTFTLMTAVFNYTQLLSGEARQLEEHFHKTRNAMYDISKNILQARFLADRFLMHNDRSFVQKHTDVIQTLNSKLNSMHASVHDEKQKIFALRVKEKIKNYSKIFDDVIQLRQANGLNHNSGLIGKLRNIIHKVESILEEQGEIFLMYSMLSMRRDEKDFISRQDHKYSQQFINNHLFFLKLLKSSGLSSKNRKHINILINKYKDQFLELVTGIDVINKKTQILQVTIDEINTSLILLENRTHLLTNEAKILYKRKENHAGIFYYTTLAATAFIGSLLMVLVIQSINRSTKQLHGALSAIANGNAVLTERIPVEGKDEMSEIAELFNLLVERLQSMMNEVSNMSQHLSNSAISAQKSKDETTQAIQTQVNEIKKIAGEIDLMSASIEGVAKNARSASERANEADNNATSGHQVVIDVIHFIQNLAENVDQAGESVERLSEHSNDIDSVVEMINSIAEQTNLLALNAAIEAARAGEAGRGFAVVADEVRSLSQKTTSSTEEIRKTIANLQQGASQATRVMQLGREQAVKSVEQAKQAGDSLSAIAKSVSGIVTLNAEMSFSASEQSVLAKQINQNIRGINEATCKLAETAQRNMSDSGDISQTASMLQNISIRFGKSDINVETSAATEDENNDIELF